MLERFVFGGGSVELGFDDVGLVVSLLRGVVSFSSSER